jgi:hypothetical protein
MLALRLKPDVVRSASKLGRAGPLARLRSQLDHRHFDPAGRAISLAAGPTCGKLAP